MSLSQLIYISDVAPQALLSDHPFSYELDLIHEKAQLNNRSVGVTGILLFSAGHFLQVLEGHHLVLNRLFQKISGDPRHTSVQKLAFISIENRIFEDWNMGLLNLNETVDLDRAIFDEIVEKLRNMHRCDEDSSRQLVTAMFLRFKQHLQKTHGPQADVAISV